MLSTAQKAEGVEDHEHIKNKTMRNLNRRSRLRTGSGRQQRSLAGKDASMDEKVGNSPAMAALACQGRGEGERCLSSPNCIGGGE